MTSHIFVFHGIDRLTSIFVQCNVCVVKYWPLSNVLPSQARDNTVWYRSIFYCIALINIFYIIGKFSYYQFESTNHVLGPVFFLSFNVFVNWIIMNMFISILNDVLVEVHTDVKLQNNDYEMVDYMLDSVKSNFLFLTIVPSWNPTLSPCPNNVIWTLGMFDGRWSDVLHSETIAPGRRLLIRLPVS